MPVYPIQSTFSRGELTPTLHGRVDIDHYRAGLQECLNFQVMMQGGLRRRPGSIFAGLAKTQSTAVVLKPFVFSETQAYVLEFSNSRLRFWTNGGLITATTQAITGITKANPAVVTYSGADTYANGDLVLIAGVVGMTEVNNRQFTVANVNAGANTFELSGINSTSYTTYVSGGTIGEIIEINTPFATADLPNIQIQQSGDAVYIACTGHWPQKLVRASETSWSIAAVSFLDGPYLDENTTTTYMTPASSGAVTPVMSNNTTPSGTVSNASDGDADAWKVFDLDVTTEPGGQSTTSGQWTYQFPGGTTKIADAYWIKASTANPNKTPTNWTFEGYDGSAWNVLDTIAGETGWAAGEVRFYEFINVTAYQRYRLNWTAVDGGTSTLFAEFGIHQSGDSQTSFNLTASATTGINGGAGWASDDPGRVIRLMGSDGRWRWAVIESRNSSTQVKVRLYGHSLPDLNPIRRWALSAFSSTDGYPRAVGFFEDRLWLGGTSTNPQTLWASRSSDYEDFGTSDPLADDDGLSLTMTGGKLNQISWIAEGADLLIGTIGSSRTIGPSASGSAFSATNAQQKQQTTIGAKLMQPVTIQGSTIFANRFATQLHEFAYDWQSNAYATPLLSILSGHLFTSGIVNLCYQQDPGSVIWVPVSDGRMQSITYDKAQQVIGCTQNKIAGGSADTYATVESACVIPTTSGDQVWMVVKRTISSGTVRYIEYLSQWDDGDTLSGAIFGDSALTYSGSAVSSLGGFFHLRGESVGILADGVDIGSATVSSVGTVTLPSGTASAITVGLRYTTRLKTLRLPQAGNQDGTAMGRLKNAGEVNVDIFETAGLLAGATGHTETLSQSTFDDTTSAVLKTGVFRVIGDDSWRGTGVTEISTNSMYPATIRALIVGAEGEP